MSRPDFTKPYTILTPGIIQRIISNQELYDKDPDRYERREREEKERRLREESERE